MNTNVDQNKEAKFEFDEMFFSRTDERGIILSGNSVFQRVSVYSWDELLHKPHNVIRHPDMPKAVFWLLWDTIKKNQPIGAYVKNRSQDGKYYWVFAIVTPIPSGFLSVRIKPSSDVFSLVEKEYKDLLQAELTDKLKPQESFQLLSNRLAELGHSNYHEFMSIALGNEVKSRNKILKRNSDNIIESLENLLSNSKKLISYVENIFKAYAENEYVPLNLRIQSAQLGHEGSTIAVISNNYSLISSEIKNYLVQFINYSNEVSKNICDSMFLILTAQLQKELVGFFSKETGAKPQEIDFNAEMEILNTQQENYTAKAIQSVNNVISKTEKFKNDCAEMKRLASSLEVIRVMGKVESSKLNVISDGLNELIDDLETFQTIVSENLKGLEQTTRYTGYTSSRILNNFQLSA